MLFFVEIDLVCVYRVDLEEVPFLTVTSWLVETAELVALTEACKVAQGAKATIYADSRYAFGGVMTLLAFGGIESI